jgi:ATP-binding cassette subfamily B protein
VSAAAADTVATPRRFLVPEVVQTSAMDCGPATLKCLLEGHGIHVSYGRLREACQTDVDGTSIDVLETVGGQLGLVAEQVMLPIDHVLEEASRALPALVVVALPDGATHFVVVWRRVGGWVQVMDPGIGRRWMSARRFLSELFVHRQPVPTESWREWAGSEEFLPVLRVRLQRIGVARGPALCAEAAADPGWARLAALDAATRMTTALVNSGGVPRGPAAGAMVQALAAAALVDGEAAIPAPYWPVRPLPDSPDGEAMVNLRGAVLVRILGVRDTAADEPLSAELAAALADRGGRPLEHLVAMLRAGGLLAPLLLVGALGVATLGGLVQTVLFRGLLEAAGQLGLVQQRLGGVAVLGLFALGLLLLELPITQLSLAMGRALEYRMRAAFLHKIPRLGDRYLQARPTSDMAQRSHAVHIVRTLPDTAARMLRALLHLGAIAAGLVWLDPGSLPVVLLATALCVGVPIAVQGPLSELDLRFRTHAGALSRFYLDAMLGLVAVRTHGAERSLRRAHENLLTDWARAGRASVAVVVTAEVVQGLMAFALSAGLFIGWLGRTGDAAAALLVVYWALELPAIGIEIGQLARLYPGLRNVTLRLLEPLGAIEEGEGIETGGEPVAANPGGSPGERRGPGDAGGPAGDERGGANERRVGVAIALTGVTVRAGGHTVLAEVDLAIAPGEHVAVVGPSGAGKSSLVGLLLGWHRAGAGEVRVDGAPLAGERLQRLRQEVAWVDPGVQLWNRSFLDNLVYGNETDAGALGPVVSAADLVGVLQKLPDGLQHVLGEGGGLLSGGEGQRVRLGRALVRTDARLVILDEPFRGLDRERRRHLLAEARRWWAGATLVCVTHDIEETLAFERVVVVEEGRVVEDDAPAALRDRPASRYRALLDAEAEVRASLWDAAAWRRLRLAGGRLEEVAGSGAEPAMAANGHVFEPAGHPAADAPEVGGG